MKIKGRGILTICLLLFGGAAVYDFYSSTKQNSALLLEARLMLLNFEQVERIDLHREGEKIALARTPEGWKIESPIQEPADNEAADQFVRDIFPERIIEVAAEGPQINWSQYGLAPAAVTITLTDSQGAAESFHISEKKNFEGNVFARKNEENKVLVLNPSWSERSQKSVVDFRDKRVLKANIASVDQLTVQNNQGSFTLQRVDGKWKVRGFNVDLDQNKVRLFLKELADAKADQIEPAAKAVAGHVPLLQLDLKLGEKTWSAKVSQSKEDKKIFALVTEPAVWLRLAPGALDDFIKKELKFLEESQIDTTPKADSAVPTALPEAANPTKKIEVEELTTQTLPLPTPEKANQ